MDQQPHCGCPVPIINPPDFGAATRLFPMPSGMPVDLPYPEDPSQVFPRVLTASADTRQGTSLSTESASGCGCDPRYPRNRRLTPRVTASYRNPGLNFAAAEVAALVNRILYPIPGIWLGPACVHMPSGNVVVQLATPRGGPFDPAPVFTYNSQASKSNLGRGYGVSDMFHPTVEQFGSITSMITGTGRYLEYTGVGEGTWGNAPASTRNGLKGKTGGGWIERQPDGLEWHYLDTGMLEKLVSPAGDVWTITRSNCLVSEIAGPGGRTTTISGGTVTQPGGRVTTFGQDEAKNLTSVSYPGGESISLTYGEKHLLSSITVGGKTTSFAYDRADRIRLLTTVDGNAYQYKYLFPETEYDTDYFVEVTDPANNVTTVVHDCNVVRAVINPKGERTTFVWEGSGDSRLKAVIDANNHATTLSYHELTYGVRALKEIERPVIGAMTFEYTGDRCTSVTDYVGNLTCLEWDASENRKCVVDAESYRFTFLYNSHRQLEFTIDPLTHRTTTVYDSAGNAESIANELNQITTLTYEGNGDARTVENPLNKVTTFTRDGLGRVTQIENPLTFKTNFTYFSDSLLNTFRNGEGELSTYNYTGERQLKLVADALNHTVDYEYDSRGNLEVVVNGNGERTTSVYDSASRMINTINPLGFVSTFTHDKVGNVLTAGNTTRIYLSLTQLTANDHTSQY
jgi:YD repeat-containing protein